MGGSDASFSGWLRSGPCIQVKEEKKIIYQDELGQSSSVATTYAAITGSPYSPKTNGRLVQIKLMLGGDAVTSLIENVIVKLGCPLWGVDCYCMATGGNIRTAAAFPIPIGVTNCDLPVKTGVDITVELINDTGATPVTPQYVVMGVFES